MLNKIKHIIVRIDASATLWLSLGCIAGLAIYAIGYSSGRIDATEQTQTDCPCPCVIETDPPETPAISPK